MNLTWLEDFLALAASGNFSRAAQLRHMTQPAFSRRIRALEEWLGVALFDRASQPATLTEAGRWLRDVAQETLARVARLPEAAQAVASGASATLRFAATHALSLTFLPAWLRGLEASAPLGPVQLVSDMQQQCETLMLQGRTQFLLCHAHAQVPGRLDGAGFRAVVVGTDAIVPVRAPAAAVPSRREGGGAQRVAVLDYSAESGLGRLTRALRPASSSRRSSPRTWQPSCARWRCRDAASPGCRTAWWRTTCAPAACSRQRVWRSGWRWRCACIGATPPSPRPRSASGAR